MSKTYVCSSVWWCFATKLKYNQATKKPLTKSAITKFLQYHFPFFASTTAVKKEYAKKLVEEVLKDVEDDGKLCIPFKDLQEFYPPLRVACDHKYDEVLKSMKRPYMLEFFLINCHPSPVFYRKPPFSYLALVDMALSYLAKLHPETLWFASTDIAAFIQTVFPFFR